MAIIEALRGILGFITNLGLMWSFTPPPFNGYHSVIINLTFFLHPIRLIYLWANAFKKKFKNFNKPTIVVSFSSLSSGVLVALTDDKTLNPRIKAWITDGGPFINLEECTSLLYKNFFSINNKYLLKFLSFLGGRSLGKKFEAQATIRAKSLPNNFPILAMLSEKDNIVPRKHTEAVFEGADLDVKTVILPRADHLQGLGLNTKLYKESVLELLEKI